MSKPGALDPVYIAARSVLLDALEALGTHRGSVIIVGSQALYLRTDEGDFAVSPFTTDADIVLDVRSIADVPNISAAMKSAGFALSNQPGTWIGRDAIAVDLIVPESLGGDGRRAARLAGHGKHAARKIYGMETALVDNGRLLIAALSSVDQRSYEVTVAGPAALLITKVLKIGERQQTPSRLDNKDALDVYRLLRAIPTSELVERVRLCLLDSLSDECTPRALQYLRGLFSAPNLLGCYMAADALITIEDAATTAASCATLVADLLDHF